MIDRTSNKRKPGGRSVRKTTATAERSDMTRRDFVRSIATTGIAVGMEAQAWAAETKSGEMIYRELGRTGEKVSAIGLGGFHIGVPKDEEEGIRIIRSAIDRGINFMDNCWDYHDGGSEIRMGKALRDGYRDKVFLMTKIDGRTKSEAAKQIEDSLKRLQTDHIDLMQHHESSAWRTPIGFLPTAMRRKRSLRRRRPARSATSASRGTRTRSCIFGCWTSPRNIAFDLMPFRCH